MPESLTPLEQRILDCIQANFPLDPDPYAVIGCEVGCSADDAFTAVNALRTRGIIRRIGGSVAAAKVGYQGVLVAAQVDQDSIEAAAQVAGSFDEVTHNYERAGAYNLWFTVIAENQSHIEEIIAAVRACPGVHAVYGLPATKTFKIKVDFKFSGDERDD